MTLSGKGMYVWKIDSCEGGNIESIVKLAVESCFSHVLLKIADGMYSYNTGKRGELIGKLRDAGIQVWGWQYVYGTNPGAEAFEAISSIRAFNLDGFVVNAEVEYKRVDGAARAKHYMQALLAGIGDDKPIALSSYRWPSYHREFPFDAFLEYCDFAMPQVYWMQAHNPASQLAQTLKEYAALTVKRQVFPTGACFRQSGWQPTAAEVSAFLQACKDLGLPGCNFWEWGNARAYVADGWEVIHSTSWTNTPAPEPTPDPAQDDGLQMRVLVDGLRMRSAPSLSAPITGSYSIGSIIRIANISGTDVWVQLPDGNWIAMCVGGKRYMEVVR